MSCYLHCTKENCGYNLRVFDIFRVHLVTEVCRVQMARLGSLDRLETEGVPESQETRAQR